MKLRDEEWSLISILDRQTPLEVYQNLQYNVDTKGYILKKAINIRMDETLLTDLDSYAQELERSRTYIIEKAVSTYFDTLDEMISDKRIDELKAGKTEVYSLEDVAQRLGLN